MKVAVAVSLLALLSVASSRAKQDRNALPALFPLFVSCDLVAQFVTPGIDVNALIRLESPVSLEGARMLEEARKQYIAAPMALLLEPTEKYGESAPVARFDASGDRARMHLVANHDHDIYASATAALPGRTGSSTWVRIRALFGPPAVTGSAGRNAWPVVPEQS